MRKMRLLIAMLLLASMFIGFNACSSDDKDDEEQHLIVGKWKSIKDDDFLEFTTTNAVKWIDENGDIIEQGIYKIERNILHRKWEHESWQIDEIRELNSTSLILVELDDDGNPAGNGAASVNPNRYQRVQ